MKNGQSCSGDGEKWLDSESDLKMELSALLMWEKEAQDDFLVVLVLSDGRGWSWHLTEIYWERGVSPGGRDSAVFSPTPLHTPFFGCATLPFPVSLH